MSTSDWLMRTKDLNFRVRDFIDGNYTNKSSGYNLISKHSPRDGSLLYSFGEGSATEVDQAVANAKAGFDDGRWLSLSIHQRQAILHKLADLVSVNKEELALYECLDVGKPITHALTGDIATVIDRLRSSADMADKLLAPSGADGSLQRASRALRHILPDPLSPGRRAGSGGERSACRPP